MSFQFENQVALVTGANRGLGKAFVEVLLELGVKKIYAAARNPEEIQRDKRVLPIALDVTQADKGTANFSDVTLLINNAGIHQNTDLLDENVEKVLRQVLEVNLHGILAVSRKVVPAMIEHESGCIINVLSAGSWLSGPGNLAYSTSKAAAMSLTNGLRAELNPKHIQVTAVHAGFIDTDMMKDFPGQKLSPKDVARQTLIAASEGKQEVLIDMMSEKSKAAASLAIPDFENE